MSLTCDIKISINEISPEKALAIKKALEPDNVNFPNGIGFTIKQKNTLLYFKLQGKNQSDLKKLISTIDEVLEHTQIVFKVIK